MYIYHIIYFQCIFASFSIIIFSWIEIYVHQYEHFTSVFIANMTYMYICHIF